MFEIQLSYLIIVIIMIIYTTLLIRFFVDIKETVLYLFMHNLKNISTKKLWALKYFGTKLILFFLNFFLKIKTKSKIYPISMFSLSFFFSFHILTNIFLFHIHIFFFLNLLYLN